MLHIMFTLYIFKVCVIYKIAFFEIIFKVSLLFASKRKEMKKAKSNHLWSFSEIWKDAETNMI